MKRVTVEVSDELHHHFKVMATKQGFSMKAIVRQLILQWLQEREELERLDIHRGISPIQSEEREEKRIL